VVLLSWQCGLSVPIWRKTYSDNLVLVLPLNRGGGCSLWEWPSQEFGK
jgi:hypothetical protein